MGTQKLNEALGIESIDSFLSSISIDDDKLKNLTELDDKFKDEIGKIDSTISEYKENGIKNIDMDDIQEPFGHIKELITVSKDTIHHIYQQLVDSEMIDSELVGSFAKLMEAFHIQVSEYINIYKDRQNFLYKMKLEDVKQKYKIEQMHIKHQMDLEKIEKSKTVNATPVENMVSYSQEELIQQLDDADNQQ
jgi:hypothetical protein